MAVQLHGSDYYDAITDDAIAAWHLDEEETIFFGAITSDTGGKPYCVISLGSVPMEFVGVRTVEQTYEFQVVYYARYEDQGGWNVELIKEQRANALLAALDHGALYDQTGLQPLVTSVVYDQMDYNDELWYVVATTFTVTRHEAA